MKPECIDLIKTQINEIETLIDLNHENEKFKDWKAKTLMILEECLGERHKDTVEFVNIRFFELTMKMFGEPDVSKADLIAYRKDLDRAKRLLNTILERHSLFSKEKKLIKLDDETIKTKIMEAVYENYKRTGFYDSLDRKALMDRLNIPKKDFDRNEEYLKRKGLIEFPAFGSLVITEFGVDYIEGKENIDDESIRGINISGIQAQGSISIVIGDLNSTISMIEQRGIGDLPALVKELTNLIETSALNQNDKLEAIENLQTITEQANKNRPNKNVVKAAAATILNKAGQIQAVAGLINNLIEWFNKIST